MNHRATIPSLAALAVIASTLVGVECGPMSPEEYDPCDGMEYCTNGCFYGECIPGEAGDPCDGDWDCNPDSICYNGDMCVGQGYLRFSLEWTEELDLDLHVETPSGSEIYYSNDAADGGELDVDDCVSDYCYDPGGTHVENIFWDSSPPVGAYRVWVENYSGADSASWRLEAYHDGHTYGESGSIEASAGAESTHYTIEID